MRPADTRTDGPGGPVPTAPVTLGLRTPSGWDGHPGVRSGRRLGGGDHAAELLVRVAGSWCFLAVVIIGTGAGAAVTVLRDSRAGPVALLGLVLSALALVEVSLVLVAIRRADRIACDVARYHLDQARRAGAVVDELRDEVQRLRTDLARVAARPAPPVRR